MTVYIHVCENCGKTEELEEEEGFQAGWDYPPRLGVFGMLSPRLCPECPITTSLWWRLIQDGKEATLSESDEELVLRVTNEPESILPSLKE